jgi:hypothetical protein
MKNDNFALRSAERMPASAEALNTVANVAKGLAVVCGVFCLFLAIMAGQEEETVSLIAAIIYGLFSVAGCLFFSVIMSALRDLVWNANRTAEYTKIKLLNDIPELNNAPVAAVSATSTPSNTSAVQQKFGALYPTYLSEANRIGVSTNELFSENDDTWHCTCGHTNDSEYIKCQRCGADIDLLRTISDKEYLEGIKK